MLGLRSRSGVLGVRGLSTSPVSARACLIAPGGGLLFGRACRIQEDGPCALLGGMDVLVAGEIVGHCLRARMSCRA